MGGNDLEAFLDEGLITLGGAGEAALVEPGGGPGDGVEQALTLAPADSKEGVAKLVVEAIKLRSQAGGITKTAGKTGKQLLLKFSALGVWAESVVFGMALL